MRKDAEANRERLVLAGKQLMQDRGGNVPVEQFCETAGVTRGTFYRNFADRAALYEAVLEFELGAMVAAFDRVDTHPLTFLRLLTEMMMVYDRFLATLPDADDYEAVRAVNSAKIAAAIAAPLQHAQSIGSIDAGLTAQDAMLVARMIASNWRLDPARSWEEALERRLAMMMNGIAPRA